MESTDDSADNIIQMIRQRLNEMDQLTQNQNNNQPEKTRQSNNLDQGEHDDDVEKLSQDIDRATISSFEFENIRQR